MARGHLQALPGQEKVGAEATIVPPLRTTNPMAIGHGQASRSTWRCVPDPDLRDKVMPRRSLGRFPPLALRTRGAGSPPPLRLAGFSLHIASK